MQGCVRAAAGTVRTDSLGSPASAVSPPIAIVRMPIVAAAPAATARRRSRRGPWRESAANSTSAVASGIAAREMAVQQRFEVQRGGGDAGALLDLERELARGDLIGAQADRENARRAVDVSGQRRELRSHGQRAVDRLAGARLAARECAGHRGAGRMALV